MGMSAAPPSHGAVAPYGPMQGARDWVWPRHGWFPCWGGKMKTQQKIKKRNGGLALGGQNFMGRRNNQLRVGLHDEGC
jgi:hypothetical protein